MTALLDDGGVTGAVDAGGGVFTTGAGELAVGGGGGAGLLSQPAKVSTATDIAHTCDHFKATPTSDEKSDMQLFLTAQNHVQICHCHGK